MNADTQMDALNNQLAEFHAALRTAARIAAQAFLGADRDALRAYVNRWCMFALDMAVIEEEEKRESLADKLGQRTAP